MVEIIQVETTKGNNELICKSLLPELFRDEVSIHRAVNNCPMNGPKFYYGRCDSISCYILMEKVKFTHSFLLGIVCAYWEIIFEILNMILKMK